MAVTLSDMRTRIRELADIERDLARHPDVQLNRYINESYKALYGMLTRAGLIRAESLQIIQAGSAPSYALLSDYFATLGVWEDFGTDTAPRRLRVHTVQTKPFGSGHTSGLASTYRVAHYLGDDRLEFNANPDSGKYIHMYVPRPKTLVTGAPANASESSDFDAVLGYDDFIVYDVVVKVLQKDDLVPPFVLAERERVMGRIADDEELRMLTATHRVADTRRYWFHDPADCYARWGCFNGYNER